MKTKKRYYLKQSYCETINIPELLKTNNYGWWLNAAKYVTKLIHFRVN
jgi:hypothetical protein